MGNAAYKRVNFEQVRSATLINVMDASDQDVLIEGTTPCAVEISVVEKALASRTPIVIYGRNDHDDRIFSKYEQIRKLGGDPHLYVGGMFEWLLLQDIYGPDLFPTTTKTLDLLKYKQLGIKNSTINNGGRRD
jgi:hypothetical protein